MRYTIAIAVAALVASVVMVIPGCSPAPPYETNGGDVGVVTDRLTGCQYVYIPNGGMAARMDKTGKQVCRYD